MFLPNYKPGFAFTANAVKKLAGGGSVYVWLTRNLAVSSSSDSDFCDLPHVDLHDSDQDVTVVKVENLPPVTSPSSRPSTSQTEHRTQPVTAPSSTSQSEHHTHHLQDHQHVRMNLLPITGFPLMQASLLHSSVSQQVL